LRNRHDNVRNIEGAGQLGLQSLENEIFEIETASFSDVNKHLKPRWRKVDVVDCQVTGGTATIREAPTLLMPLDDDRETIAITELERRLKDECPRSRFMNQKRTGQFCG